MNENKVRPTVSIITVVFNAVNDIEKTILSITSQTYCDYEYIIVDGGSKDGTIDIVHKYSDYIDSFVSEPDKGIYDAMNKGIAMSHGKWLSFMNAGDLYADNHVLENIFKNAIPENVGLIYGDVIMNYANGGETLKKLDNVSIEMVPYSMCHQSTLIDGDFMRATLFDLSYNICADANSFKEVLDSELLSYYVPVAISIYEATKGVSAKQLLKINDEFLRIKGVPKYSLTYFRSKIRANLKLLPQRILSEKQYNAFMAKYVKFRNR